MQSLIFSLGVLDNITKPIGKIFQPLLDFVASILAFFYSIIPNYPVSIALLTIVIMAILTPLTVKSTKSMAAMQALGPEMKKLQQKYKGAENRAQLNEEMMKLYKEHKVNPASGCLPMLLQLPAFLVLYDVIRGITNTVQVHGHTVAQPRYIPHNTAMYHDIIAGHGALESFGMDFAKKLLPFSSHSSVWAALPYLFLVLASIGLQYLQMSRLSKRNPGASANPQAAMLQKYMPIVFGLIYLNIPAAVNVYFIVSSAIRIGTQEVLFRRGIVGGPPARAEEKENPARPSKPTRRAEVRDSHTRPTDTAEDGIRKRNRSTTEFELWWDWEPSAAQERRNPVDQERVRTPCWCEACWCQAGQARWGQAGYRRGKGDFGQASRCAAGFEPLGNWSGKRNETPQWNQANQRNRQKSAREPAEHGQVVGGRADEQRG